MPELGRCKDKRNCWIEKIVKQASRKIFGIWEKNRDVSAYRWIKVGKIEENVCLNDGWWLGYCWIKLSSFEVWFPSGLSCRTKIFFCEFFVKLELANFSEKIKFKRIGIKFNLTTWKPKTIFKVYDCRSWFTFQMSPQHTKNEHKKSSKIKHFWENDKSCQQKKHLKT